MPDPATPDTLTARKLLGSWGCTWPDGPEGQALRWEAEQDIAQALAAARVTPAGEVAERDREAGRRIAVHFWYYDPTLTDVAAEQAIDCAAAAISSVLASARAEERKRCEDVYDALQRIEQWCDAYPADIFIEPDLDKAAAALAAAGISMDGLHGSWARHLLMGIGKIAREALAALERAA